jgi:hypothetical protein
MQSDAMAEGNGQHMQVGPDPLDYVLRYTPADYDCYYQGRYIGSRATLPKRSRRSNTSRPRPHAIRSRHVLRTSGSLSTSRSCAPLQRACTTSRRSWPAIPPSRR